VNRFVCLFALLFAVSLTMVASAGQAQQTPSKPATTTHHATTTQATHTGTDPALLHPAMLRAKAPDEYDVKFVTTKGDFVVHVTRAWAPNGADRFYNLVKHGFFTNASFFRVVSGFVVQFGMSADPKVNAALLNANIKDDPVKQSNKPGTITFAQTGQPNTRSTQVFINLGDNASLDAQNFPPFGQVTSGMEVVQQLYSGYGDLPEMGGRGPSQERIASGGEGYLRANFPKLDSIKSATAISPAATTPATPAHKPAAGKSGAKPQS
jgi:peptidyl-prolyl cis-trans isomerase A (cyclophilin A)